MEKDDPKPEPKPAGHRLPPRPPRGIAVGLSPDDDDSGPKRAATITNAADGEGKFIRHSGGRDHYGHVIVRIEPNGRGKGIAISSDVSADTISVKYIRHMTVGIRGALKAGIGRNSPIVDVIVSIVGGSWHVKDSSEISFAVAGALATMEGLKKAGLVPVE